MEGLQFQYRYITNKWKNMHIITRLELQSLQNKSLHESIPVSVCDGVHQ